MEEEKQVSVSNNSADGTKKKVLLITVGALVVLGVGTGGYFAFGKKSGTIVTEDGSRIKYTTDNKTTTLSDEEGTLSVGEEVKLPSDFPGNVPIYPNAKFTSAWSSNKNSVPGDDTSDIKAGYTATVRGTLEDINAWFKSEYLKKGWKIDVETKYGLTVSSSTEISGTTVSVMDKSEANISTSTGEQDYDKAMEEAQKSVDEMQSIIDENEGYTTE